MRVLVIDEGCEKCGGEGRIKTTVTVYRDPDGPIVSHDLCDCVHPVEIEAVLTLHANLKTADGDYAFDEALPIREKGK